MRWDVITAVIVLVLAAAGTLMLIGPGWSSLVAWWTYWMRKPPAPATLRAYRLMGFICAAGILAIAAYVVIYVLSRG
jgi:hypothetical protein